MPNIDLTHIETLAPGVTCEWLSDRQILVMTASDSSRSSVDAWINRATAILQEWPTDQPWLVIIDASNPNITRTPYMRERLHRLMSLRPDITSCIALMPPKTYVAQLMRLGIKFSRNPTKIEVFFSRAEAVRWLESKIETR